MLVALAALPNPIGHAWRVSAIGAAARKARTAAIVRSRDGASWHDP
ncbi:hypothetical protein K2Z84_17725 [Candidatus Binatia bacterium]|nr:hypothetical protein [Candidatus Binatia bacterium]